MRFRAEWFAVLTVFMLLLWVRDANCGPMPDREKLGIIRGEVADAETLTPLANANVSVQGNKSVVAADEDGLFEIKDLPVGSYVLRFSHVGYEALTRTDIVVKSARAVFVEARLKSTAIKREGIVVTAGYFADAEDKPGSSIGFSGEEIRRAPGSAGDVSRIVLVLPSVAKVNDQQNSLMVRGGTPSENGFYIDNIEVPNINHFPLQGTSGGPIGLVNVDFVSDVSFAAGGFSAAYGDKLSSVMELAFREGNRQNTDWQLDFNFAGLGFIGEGPLFGRRGAWLVSARRSYLDLIVDLIGVGVVPRYSDYQGKATYDLSPKNRLSWLGLLGVDFIEWERDESADDGMPIYGRYDGYEYATGLNWRCLWSEKGYSNTSFAYLGTRLDGEWWETKSERLLTDENYSEEAVQVRNVNTYRFNHMHKMEFGVEGKLYLYRYDSRFSDYTNSIGDPVPALTIDDYISAPAGAVFTSHTVNPVPELSTTLGFRYDYFEYNEGSQVSPRFSFKYDFTQRMSVHGAAGIYSQHLPLSLLSSKESYRYLKDPLAYHYLLGLSRLLTENTKLTLEGYYKDYRNFPQDPDQPQIFVADEIVFRSFFGNRDRLLDGGRAKSYGVELTVQKKLVQGIYGLVSATYSRAKYRDMDGNWKDRVYDNRVVLSAEGGYKPNNKWEFSTRWIYAGGPPYTPLDLQASREINRLVIDRNRVNEERYPDYHSLNIRLDRRFYFSGSNLTVYLSVWNAYNRKNIARYYWNEIAKEQDVEYQWSAIPIIGVEFEF